MKNLGYYNGKFGEASQMSIPMADRVCYFGDGVYDATYSRDYKIFLLDEHIDKTPAGGKAPELLKKIQDEMLREFTEETN